MLSLTNPQNYIKKENLQLMIQQNQTNQKLFIGYKNDNILMQEATEAIALGAGFRKAQQVCGLTDYEMPHIDASLAQSYVEQDKKVLKGSKLTMIDLVPLRNEKVLAITTRIPVINDQFNIIGSAFFTNRHPAPTNFLSSLIKENVSQEKKSGVSLILNEENILPENSQDDKLSKREFEILWLVCRGLSSKKIANFFNRSPRTIEDHIENIKMKYKCTYKSELIEMAINQGILNYLPISLALRN